MDTFGFSSSRPAVLLKRLFVTGAHGFVGQWIQRLAPELAGRHGYGLALPPTDFDLLDPAQVDAQLGEHRPDAILHLAAQSNVPQSFTDPEATFRINLFGTLRLFEGIKRTGLSPRVDRKSTRLNSSHIQKSRMPSSA